MTLHMIFLFVGNDGGNEEEESGNEEESGYEKQSDSLSIDIEIGKTCKLNTLKVILICFSGNYIIFCPVFVF